MGLLSCDHSYQQIWRPEGIPKKRDICEILDLKTVE